MRNKEGRMSGGSQGNVVFLFPAFVLLGELGLEGRLLLSAH